MSKEPEQKLGTCIVVTNSEGKILLGKRLNSYRSGWFGMPGGRLNIGEPLEKCAGRELLEETNLTPKSLEFLGTIRDNQDTYDFIHFAYVCTDYEGVVTLTEPDKCEEWKWYSLDEIPEKILPGHVSAIELYKASLHSKNTFLVDMSV